LLLSTLLRLPTSTLFPYTTLFRSTSELMILFYEYLTQGQSKSEALQNAKLSYLENVQFEELAHPFYWAGFVLSGDDAPINFSPPDRKSTRLNSSHVKISYAVFCLK